MKNKLATVERVVPKEKSLHDKVQDDAKHFDEIYKVHQEQLNKGTKRHAYAEVYLLAWTMVEQMLLPSLIRQISHRLGLKKVPDTEGKHISHVINYYYFLSQDAVLYEALCKANKDRNKILHGLKTADDIASINKKTRTATKYLLKNVTLSILTRLVSKNIVPVLTLYSKGWNDCRTEILKKLDTFKNAMDN